eukprot:6973146-Pyramimonas_sp.AAC.1
MGKSPCTGKAQTPDLYQRKTLICMPLQEFRKPLKYTFKGVCHAAVRGHFSWAGFEAHTRAHFHVQFLECTGCVPDPKVHAAMPTNSPMADTRPCRAPPWSGAAAGGRPAPRP